MPFWRKSSGKTLWATPTSDKPREKKETIMALNVDNHPCFNSDVRKTAARVHLPVAPRCNVQCHYCNRDFDCANESRPGVTTSVLTPEQALVYLQGLVAKNPAISVVGIAGPGDPFANPEETMETLRLVRRHFPEMLLCVATNGLGVLPYIEELAQLQVSHVTITVNAVRPEVTSKIYAWMRYDGRTHTGLDAATELWERQARAISGLKEAGVTVKVNTIFIPNCNDQHLDETARTVAALGADILNIIPLYPVKGTIFETLKQPSHDQMMSARLTAGHYLPQMAHCQRCRADAAGFLGEDMKQEVLKALKEAAALNPGTLRDQLSAAREKKASRSAAGEKPFIAVATLEGILINLHLGEAPEFHLFDTRTQDLQAAEVRKAPPAGNGDERWQLMAQTLKDCSHVLVSGIGKRPREVLEAEGLKIHEVEGLVRAGVKALREGRDLGFMGRRAAVSCSSVCGGTSTGCG